MKLTIADEIRKTNCNNYFKENWFERVRERERIEKRQNRKK